MYMYRVNCHPSIFDMRDDKGHSVRKTEGSLFRLVLQEKNSYYPHVIISRPVIG